jgi:hypothetical protein
MTHRWWAGLPSKPPDAVGTLFAWCEQIFLSVELPGMCGDLNELRGGDRGHSDGLVIHILRIAQCCFGQSKEGTGREEVLQLRRAK